MRVHIVHLPKVFMLRNFKITLHLITTLINMSIFRRYWVVWIYVHLLNHTLYIFYEIYCYSSLTMATWVPLVKSNSVPDRLSIRLHTAVLSHWGLLHWRNDTWHSTQNSHIKYPLSNKSFFHSLVLLLHLHDPNQRKCIIERSSNKLKYMFNISYDTVYIFFHTNVESFHMSTMSYLTRIYQGSSSAYNSTL